MLKMKKFKAVAVILALLMVVTQVVPVFAADTTGGSPESYNYVSLGASNSNGYGLADYFTAEQYAKPGALKFSECVGIDKEVEGSYPVLVKEWLQEKLGSSYSVELYQLGGSGMRTHELRMLLDDSYYGDRFTEYRFYNANDESNKNKDNWFGKKANLSQYRTLYKESIEKADFISIDIGENDFTSFLMMALLYKSALYGDNSNYNADDDINDLKYTLTQSEKANFVKITKWVNENILPKLGNEKITSFLNGGEDNIADTIAYAYISFCKNFDESIKKIRDLNSEADIVVLGIQNPISDINIKIDNYTLPLGDVVGLITDMANSYIAGKSALKKEYTYTNCGVYGHVDNIGSALTDYEGDPSVFTEDGEKKTFAMYCDTLESILYPATHVLMWMYKYKEAESSTSLIGASDAQIELVKKCGESSGSEASLNKQLRCFWSDVDTNTQYNINKQNPREIVKGEQYSGIYNAGYLAAWNLIGWVARMTLENDTIDLGSIDNLKNIDLDKIDDSLLGKMNQKLDDVIGAGCTAAISKKTYDYSKVGRTEVREIFTDLEWAVLSLYVRATIANSAASHPSIEGHKQLAKAVETAYEKQSYSFDDLETGIKSNIKSKIQNLTYAAKETVEDIILAKISSKLVTLFGDKINELKEKADDNWFYNIVYQLVKTVITTG